MAEPFNLAPVQVHAVSVPVRRPPNSIAGPDEMMLQLGENGGVQVDVFGRDAQGNELHESREMQEDEYEEMRKGYLRAELATMPPFSSFKSGNTIGRVVGETAPAPVPASQANPPIEAETEEEGITGEQVLDGIQLGLGVIGLIPGVGELADLGNAGISFVRGDYAGAALSLAAAVPFAGALATAGKIGKRATDLAGASKPVKKTPKETPGKPTEGKKGDGGSVEDNGKDCRLRPYSQGCHAGKTPHHVVPDRVFRMPGDGGVRLPNGISHKDGFCICVDGASPRKKGPRPNEHGMIHALYDAEEQAIGALGDPVGTAPLWKLEAAGVTAASAITGCNPIIMAAQLRAHHQSKGLLPSGIYRADPAGVHIRNVIPDSLGKTTTPKGSGGL